MKQTKHFSKADKHCLALYLSNKNALFDLKTGNAKKSRSISDDKTKSIILSLLHTSARKYFIKSRHQIKSEFC